MDLPSSNNEFGHPMSKSAELSSFQKKLSFSVVGAIVFWALAHILLFSAPADFPAETIVSVKEGASLRFISQDLKVKNVIRSRVVFETFTIIFGGEKYLESGDYFFEKKLPAFEIARRLTEGERRLAPIKVTVPEGFNIPDIAKLFASKLADFDREKFLAEAKGKDGYLFPDTYFFLTTDNEENVLRSMSENFEKKMAPLRPKIVSVGRTEKEIIVMASLIEKESKGDADRRLISGILWKRLAKNMPLQVDAEPGTYKKRGLPENPIANPGMEAIQAAIYPEKSPYLYYLHDKQGDIHFAKTFEEHLLNKRRYLK